MTSAYDTDRDHSRRDLSRRSLLAAAGLGTAAALVGTALPGTASAAGTVVTPDDWHPHGPVPPVAGLHAGFGADPATQMTVSWHTTERVRRPRLLLARRGHTYERTVPATETSYTDAKSGQVVYAYHARINGLSPANHYDYAAMHDMTAPELGSFLTAPRGRQPFTFTSFGDQGTPTVGRRYVPPEGMTIANPPYVNDNLGSPASGDTTAGIEHVAPLFHLFNGDLCYANLADDRVRTWSDFWDNNSRSTRHRPWMPTAGNHENELGNGSIGYRAYQTYFDLPRLSGQTDETAGLWYAYTVGSVRFVHLQNDDICYQDGGSSYVKGYSHGAQKRWLATELKVTRESHDIDWIVVCMHQVAISSANFFNGADLGIRQEWLPLFDEYGVDLVVCGHEHHYERTLPIRGQRHNQTRTPITRGSDIREVDTGLGTVHMIIGGGGTSAPSNQLLFDPPQCRVIVGVGDVDPTTGKHVPIYVTEGAPWSAKRDAAHSYGFAAFEVDPGHRAGGRTTMRVTYYDVESAYGTPEPFETFTLYRSRTDG